MRTIAILCLLSLAALSPAAPQLGDKPPKWEYAELAFRTTPARPGGVDVNGNEVPATPATTTIRWITAAGEVEVKSWEELADKLKVTGFKKDGSADLQRIQVLNALGAEGWELMEPTSSSSGVAAFGGPGRAGPGAATLRTTTAATWMMKRRLP
jgi:hypothetical protein